MPVGGVGAKLAAAEASGVKTVFIPKDNWQESFADLQLEVIPVERIEEIFQRAIVQETLRIGVMA